MQILILDNILHTTYDQGSVKKALSLTKKPIPSGQSFWEFFAGTSVKSVILPAVIAAFGLNMKDI